MIIGITISVVYVAIACAVRNREIEKVEKDVFEKLSIQMVGTEHMKDDPPKIIFLIRNDSESEISRYQ